MIILEKAGIHQSESDSYSDDQIKNAIRNGYGITNFEMRCSSDSSYEYLTDIRICLDL